MQYLALKFVLLRETSTVQEVYCNKQIANNNSPKLRHDRIVTMPSFPMAEVDK